MCFQALPSMPSHVLELPGTAAQGLVRICGSVLTGRRRKALAAVAARRKFGTCRSSRGSWQILGEARADEVGCHVRPASTDCPIPCTGDEHRWTALDFG